jgi:hypothetical protein
LTRSLQKEIPSLRISGDIDYIKYGMSFGECSGYCITENTLEELIRTNVRITWHEIPNHPRLTEVTDLNQAYWNSFNASLDFKSFLKLPKRIGCPDCHDGGASWIEISKSGVIHKVTFEYMHPPKELLGLIELLEN